jgi:hypothetical protein
VIAAVGFWFFGVPHPLAWGVAVVFAAFVPLLGSPLGWIPAVVYLYYVSTLQERDRPARLRRGRDQRHRQRRQAADPPRLRPDPPAARLPGDPGRRVRVRARSASWSGPWWLSLGLSAIRIYRDDVLRKPLSAGLTPPERAT